MTAAPYMAGALPDDIASLVLRIGRAEWGATAEQTAEEHASDLLNTVSLTHEHFGTEDPQPMNGLYIEGTGVVICHTGMSPNSAGIARALTGAWNLLHSTALAALDSVASLPAPDDKDAEIARLRAQVERLTGERDYDRRQSAHKDTVIDRLNAQIAAPPSPNPAPPGRATQTET